jgi:hypothetical protein
MLSSVLPECADSSGNKARTLDFPGLISIITGSLRCSSWRSGVAGAGEAGLVVPLKIPFLSDKVMVLMIFLILSGVLLSFGRRHRFSLADSHTPKSQQSITRRCSDIRRVTYYSFSFSA